MTSTPVQQIDSFISTLKETIESQHSFPRPDPNTLRVFLCIGQHATKEKPITVSKIADALKIEKVIVNRCINQLPWIIRWFHCPIQLQRSNCGAGRNIYFYWISLQS